jgi:purine-binding chemotaxis protein CheW
MKPEQRNLLEEQEDMLNRYLLFSIGDEVYGTDIRFVTEIIGMQTISGLPQTPEYIKGIIDLRGRIIPIIDMRLRFKKQAADYTDRTCTIVIEAQTLLVGLIVDEVMEVLTIEDRDIAPPPMLQFGAAKRYISGIAKVGSGVKLLLDCEQLFSEEEAQVISGIREGGLEKKKKVKKPRKVDSATTI